jgi:hypothetical protein
MTPRYVVQNILRTTRANRWMVFDTPFRVPATVNDRLQIDLTLDAALSMAEELNGLDRELLMATLH